MQKTWLLLATVLDSIRVALRDPRAFVGALRAARRPLRRSRRPRALAFFARLRSYLPLVLVRPDVVHFEWNSAAIQFQPLATVWSCPTVVSCHGSEVNVRPRLDGGATFARALGASLARADAVHCVSHQVATKAIGYGADPRKTRLIHPGVDSASFHPSRCASCA